MSSSSSSSSSSNSSSSSSSSSRDIVARSVIVTSISQNNYTLLPFTYIGEAGRTEDLGTSAELPFTIDTSSDPYLTYDNVIDRDNSDITTTPSTTPSVYVPEDDETKYHHKASIYVDIIALDAGGVRDIRTHVEPDKYEFEDVNGNDVFYIPKFSWE